MARTRRTKREKSGFADSGHANWFIACKGLAAFCAPPKVPPRICREIALHVMQSRYIIVEAAGGGKDVEDKKKVVA